MPELAGICWAIRLSAPRRKVKKTQKGVRPLSLSLFGLCGGMSRKIFFWEGLYADAILPDGDILFAGTGRIMLDVVEMASSQ
jgi:hypothetical protein